MGSSRLGVAISFSTRVKGAAVFIRAKLPSGFLEPLGLALSTRQLAQRVMAVRGLQAGDKVLVKAVAARLIHVLHTHRKARKIIGDTKRRGVIVWRLPV